MWAGRSVSAEGTWVSEKVTVSVCVAEARNVRDANEQCRRLPAYRQIVATYPASEWHRQHISTTRHPQCGMWMVEFAVRRRTNEKSPHQPR